MVPADHRSANQHGLVAGPVGRRVRRDRPSERRRPALPTVETITQAPIDAAATAPSPAPATEQGDHGTPSVDRGDRSPLPTHPLPPAALPSRANRLPAMDSLPATPSAVSPGDLPQITPPPAEEPSHPDGAPVAEELAIGSDGMVAVDGMIVRSGGTAHRVGAIRVDGSPIVTIAEGWCWVSPGGAPVDEVVVVLPQAQVRIPGRATALAVVEQDGSAFVIVADGTVALRRTDDAVDLERGSIAMVDPTGGTQVDRASDEEIQSDPIVAENLSLGAEL